MFHPFSSINTVLSKSIQVRPVLYFTAKMGATSVEKSVGEYSAEYSPYSRNKPFTPILPVRTIFSPILHLPARPDLSLYYS